MLYYIIIYVMFRANLVNYFGSPKSLYHSFATFLIQSKFIKNFRNTLSLNCWLSSPFVFQKPWKNMNGNTTFRQIRNPHTQQVLQIHKYGEQAHNFFKKLAFMTKFWRNICQYFIHLSNKSHKKILMVTLLLGKSKIHPLNKCNKSYFIHIYK